ncbi:MAG: glutamine--fructose-6-phosphate transaminase (isomerizing), partial [Anaerolineae bacterium]|nr:glutamine--fructose-6-phosphate transaminase (isomerizing) [Anaerolineae bacterium]
GYVGGRQAAPLVLQGLGRLAYRGYDSAGLAVIGPEGLALRRSVGKLENLSHLLEIQPAHGHVGIGHTRWATHGAVTEDNAHPHTDCRRQVVVIQNGIVENYLGLKQRLLAEGHGFRSETDTEVIAHLIEAHLAAGDDLPTAVGRSLQALKGANCIVVLSAHDPERIVAARLGNAGGLVVGLGEGETLVASDMPALLGLTQRVVFLEDREMAILSPAGASYWRLDGAPLEKEPETVSLDPEAAARGRYRHFMQKEIYEQARTVTDVLHGRVDFQAGEVSLAELSLPAERLRGVRRIHTVACGTAWHAGLLGKFMIERLARIPVEVDYGSEFRYRDALLDPDDLVVAVTQSGETVDTLAAMEEARNRGVPTLSIVNAVGSQAARLADGTLYLNAGPEIGVASTKAFTSMLVAQYLLAIYLAQLRGTLAAEVRRRLVEDLAALPNLVGEALAGDGIYDELAERFAECSDFLYLGRGINYPIALEGALKLKEISYIHAEGYPAGEMKHGPIALIDDRMPVVAIVARDHVREKMLGNVEQVRARGGTVIAVAAADDAEARSKAHHVLPVPHLSPLLNPVLNVLPLQLLAYHLAVRRGCDVDQPRNLAKSVTVE